MTLILLGTRQNLTVVFPRPPHLLSRNTRGTEARDKNNLQELPPEQNMDSVLVWGG